VYLAFSWTNVRRDRTSLFFAYKVIVFVDFAAEFVSRSEGGGVEEGVEKGREVREAEGGTQRSGEAEVRQHCC